MILAGIILSGSFSGVMTFILFYLLEWAFQYLNKEAIKKKLPLALISLAVFLVGVVAVLWGIIRTLWKPAFDKGIWFAGAGTVLTVLALLLVAGYNNTAYYPSTHDLQSSLTLANSCSSQFTLKVMAYVSILVPFVLAYIFYAWRSIDNRKIDAKEMEEGGHAY